MSKEYRSSVSAFQDFVESSVWQDILHELDVWLEDSRNILESDEKAPDIETVKLVQGRVRAIREVKQMPYVIIENIKQDNEKGD
jgi:hypothetical protein